MQRNTVGIHCTTPTWKKGTSNVGPSLKAVSCFREQGKYEMSDENGEIDVDQSKYQKKREIEVT
jgi:hypothetical protein